MPKVKDKNQELFNAAESGDCDAQSFLAMLYREGGEGLEKDIKKSVEWETRSAEQGYVDAQFSLAEMYEKKAEVKDLYKAKYWHKKAAEQGHEEALEKLRNYEQLNINKPVPVKKSFRWVKLGIIIFIIVNIAIFSLQLLLSHSDSAIKVGNTPGIVFVVVILLLFSIANKCGNVSSRTSIKKRSTSSATGPARASSSSKPKTQVFFAKDKYCATCTYWKGNRAPLASGRQIQAELSQSLCTVTLVTTNPNTGISQACSPFKRLPYFGNNCKDYKQWL